MRSDADWFAEQWGLASLAAPSPAQIRGRLFPFGQMVAAVLFGGVVIWLAEAVR